MENLLKQIEQTFGIGCRMICEERFKQINKHGYTAQHHQDNPKYYENHQLQYASATLLMHEIEEQIDLEAHTPEGWDEFWFAEMNGRTRERRLQMSGGMLAAELDRVNEQ